MQIKHGYRILCDVNFIEWLVNSFSVCGELITLVASDSSYQHTNRIA